MSADTATVRLAAIGADSADVCGRDGCSRTDDVRVTTRRDRGTRVLCRPCRKAFFEVSS